MVYLYGHPIYPILPYNILSIVIVVASKQAGPDLLLIYRYMLIKYTEELYVQMEAQLEGING